MTGRRWWTAMVAVGLLAVGCTKPPTPVEVEPADEPATAASTAASGPLRFWHTQTQENDAALVEIINAFNQMHPDKPAIEPTYIGSYNQLYEKIRATAAESANPSLPDLAVAYESMIADYMAAGIVVPLDDYLADPEIGLDSGEQADIQASYLETNRFPQFDNKLLSFPFTKSNLMLYYNLTMLEEVGEGPPVTWDDFIRCCNKIKAKRGILPYATSIDPSTFDGMIFAMGGELLDESGTNALFDSPETLDVLRVMERLFKDELAYQVSEKGDQNNDFANEKCAFFFRSSTARPFLQELIGDKFKWNMTTLPVKAGVDPVTVMFGANICILKSTEERQRHAWEFIKYFTSSAVTAKWATATGYLPVRISALEDQVIKDFLAAAPQNATAFKAVAIAKPEPNVAGWQAVRKCLGDAETTIINLLKSPEEVAAELDRCADAALAAAE